MRSLLLTASHHPLSASSAGVNLSPFGACMIGPVLPRSAETVLRLPVEDHLGASRK